MRLRGLTFGLALLWACGSSSAPTPNAPVDTAAPGKAEPAAGSGRVVQTGTDGGEQASGDSFKLKSPPIQIPNARYYDGYVIGGLPTTAQIDAAIEGGFESAMSLMTSGEPGIDELAPYAVSQGVRYMSFGVELPDDLNEAMAWQFAATLALLDKPAIIHSAHGRRVAALFALMAYFVDEMPADKALALGEALGMGELSEQVQELLKEPAW